MNLIMEGDVYEVVRDCGPQPAVGGHHAYVTTGANSKPGDPFEPDLIIRHPEHGLIRWIDLMIPPHFRWKESLKRIAEVCDQENELILRFLKVSP